MRAHVRTASTREIGAALAAVAMVAWPAADALATQRNVLGELFSADG